MDLCFKIKEIPQNGVPLRHTREIPAPLLVTVLEGTDGDPAHARGALEIDLFRDHESVIVRGRLRGALELPCARCVEPAKVPFDIRVDAMYEREGTARANDEAQNAKKNGKDGEPDDVEALLEEPDRFEHDGKVVDLEGLVREALIAELPLSPLCKYNCAGLCPQCGANRNTPEGRACGHTVEIAAAPQRQSPLAGLAKIKLSS